MIGWPDPGEADGTCSPDDVAGTVSMAGRPRTRSTLCAPRIRWSRRSVRNARARPMTRPATTPLGSTIFCFGVVGLAGGTALVMMDPPELAALAAVNAATWLDSWVSSLLSAFRSVCALALLGALLGRDAIWALSPAAVFCSEAIFDCSALSWALIDCAA